MPHKHRSEEQVALLKEIRDIDKLLGDLSEERAALLHQRTELEAKYTRLSGH